MEFLEIAQNMDEKNKNEILSAFLEKKYTLSPKFDELQNFLNEHTDKDGYISDADAKVYDKMEENLKKELDIMNNKIDSILNRPTSKPIFEQPSGNGLSYSNAANAAKFGVSGRDYSTHFTNAVRTNFRAMNELQYLQIADPASGGYLVPSEMHDQIIVGLREQNILRQISTVITTQSQHKIILQGNAPSAAWVSEGTEIPLATETFDQKTLDAYKCAASITVSNEVLQDSYYNLNDHISSEFSRAIAEKEEQAFFNGDGDGKPLGLLPQIADSDSGITTVTTAGASLATDDLISTVYKLGTPYRQKACWIVNNSTLSAIRKLKDNTNNYLWENNLQAGAPARILGYPVYTSENLPTIESGAIVAIFGDFSKLIIGQRGNLVFKPLYETLALRDLTAFVMIERVDCCLTDPKAIVALKMKNS